MAYFSVSYRADSVQQAADFIVALAAASWRNANSQTAVSHEYQDKQLEKEHVYSQVSEESKMSFFEDDNNNPRQLPREKSLEAETPGAKPGVSSTTASPPPLLLSGGATSTKEQAMSWLEGGETVGGERSFSSRAAAAAAEEVEEAQAPTAPTEYSTPPPFSSSAATPPASSPSLSSSSAYVLPKRVRKLQYGGVTIGVKYTFQDRRVRPFLNGYYAWLPLLPQVIRQSRRYSHFLSTYCTC